jgi:hypothetical protein
MPSVGHFCDDIEHRVQDFFDIGNTDGAIEANAPIGARPEPSYDNLREMPWLAGECRPYPMQTIDVNREPENIIG